MNVDYQKLKLSTWVGTPEDKQAAEDEFIQARAYYKLIGVPYNACGRCFARMTEDRVVPFGFRKIHGCHLATARRLKHSENFTLITSAYHAENLCGPETKLAPGLYVRCDHYLMMFYADQKELNLGLRKRRRYEY